MPTLLLVDDLSDDPRLFRWGGLVVVALLFAWLIWQVVKDAQKHNSAGASSYIKEQLSPYSPYFVKLLLRVLLGSAVIILGAYIRHSLSRPTSAPANHPSPGAASK
jgi:hypothetical protein